MQHPPGPPAPVGDGAPLSVVGGGVIGLSIARRAALDGWAVTVHRAPERGASWVAGGMLAPHSEAWPGEDAQLDIGLRSLRLWQATGPGSYLDGLPADVVTTRSSLVVAVDRADAADLRTVAGHLAAQGHPVELVNDARRLEPTLASGIRHGFVAGDEWAVDNRALVQALESECTRLGVRWADPLPDADAFAAVPGHRVLAAGIDSPRFWPGLPVRPVKGEILRLRRRPGVLPPPARTVRARVHGRSVYLVPRADGVVVGATQYEHGRDTSPTVTGVRELLDDACAVVPSLGEYELAEIAAGLRPGTPDNLPIVERLDDRTVVATGHGRNGFLLTPWTVERVAGLLADSRQDPAAASSAIRTDPHRVASTVGATT